MTDGSTERVALRIRKRDGTVELFSLSKLRECLRRGLETAAEGYDFAMAAPRELADAVHEYLLRENADRPIASDRILELVELVLNQIGQSSAAMVVRQYAERKTRLRRRLLVASTGATSGRFIHKRWSKAKLIQHLRGKHLLDASTSRMIAGRVEQLIFNCNFRVVTTGLVVEMTRSELMTWGLVPAAFAVKRAHRSHKSSRVRDDSRLA
jgi:hypothetical protein